MRCLKCDDHIHVSADATDGEGDEFYPADAVETGDFGKVSDLAADLSTEVLLEDTPEVEVDKVEPIVEANSPCHRPLRYPEINGKA